ncbi:hypothetical protein Mro03_38390 [Microbispora rosea subsp. rosea]|nr:hypothetical protein Mro03_38390 [Microbispora rosea subsp. rosea]
MPAEGRAALRELAEGQPPLSADDRDGARAQPGLGIEQIGKTGVLRWFPSRFNGWSGDHFLPLRWADKDCWETAALGAVTRVPRSAAG